MQFLLYFIYYVFSLLGMFVHFLKKEKLGQTSTEMRRYLHDNFTYTLYAATATTVAYLGLLFADVTMFQSINLVTFTACFGAGYAFDSAINKWEN